MQHHLDEISRRVAAGAHAVVTLDKAGWHTTRKLQVPSNISLLHPPPASPELNPTENVWRYLRQSYLSNRVFRDYNDVVEAIQLSLEQAHRRTRKNRINRHTKLDRNQSRTVKLDLGQHLALERHLARPRRHDPGSAHLVTSLAFALAAIALRT
jgi:transposase